MIYNIWLLNKLLRQKFNEKLKIGVKLEVKDCKIFDKAYCLIEDKQPNYRVFKCLKKLENNSQ